MDPFGHYSYLAWRKFLKKNNYSCFIQVREKDGAYFETNINGHKKNNLFLGDELSSENKKVIAAIPRLPTSMTLVFLDEDLIKTIALRIIKTLMQNGQDVGMGREH